MTFYNHDKFGLLLGKTALLAALLTACNGDDGSGTSVDETTTGDGDGDPGDGDPGDGDPGDGDPGDGDPGDGDPGDGDPGDGDPGDGDPGDGDPGDGDPGDGDPGDGDPGDGDPGDGDPGDGDPGDGDPGDEDFAVIGDPCMAPDTFSCVPELDGQAGTPLRCDFVTNQWAPSQNFDVQCFASCQNQAVNACGGVGVPAVCMCSAGLPATCDQVELGCTGPNELTLCHDDEVVVGACTNCSETSSGYFNCE